MSSYQRYIKILIVFFFSISTGVLFAAQNGSFGTLIQNGNINGVNITSGGISGNQLQDNAIDATKLSHDGGIGASQVDGSVQKRIQNVCSGNQVATNINTNGITCGTPACSSPKPYGTFPNCSQCASNAGNLVSGPALNTSNCRFYNTIYACNGSDQILVDTGNVGTLDCAGICNGGSVDYNGSSAGCGSPQPSCTDSDGGKNAGVAGSVVSYNAQHTSSSSFTDICATPANGVNYPAVYEGYCDANMVATNILTACGAGQVCQNGACVTPTCTISSYSAWSACSKTCGTGTQTRTDNCGNTYSQDCNTQACSSGGTSCTYTSVLTAGSCYYDSNSCQDICSPDICTYDITSPATGGGTCPVAQGQTSTQCAYPTACTYTTSYGACSGACGSSYQSYTFHITTPATNGGSCAVADGQMGTQACDLPPGTCGAWSGNEYADGCTTFPPNSGYHPYSNGLGCADLTGQACTRGAQTLTCSSCDGNGGYVDWTCQ